MISINKKLIIITCVFFFSIIYAFPNIYGEDPVIIINSKTKKIDNDLINEFKQSLKKNNIKNKLFTLKDENNLIINFFSTEEQFTAYELLKTIDNKTFKISLNILNSNQSSFLEKINAYPMKLGLDLRGGIHLLIKVNTNNNLIKMMKIEIPSLKKELNKRNIKYKKIKINKNNIMKIKFKSNIQTKLGYDFLKQYLLNFNVINHKQDSIKIQINKTYKKEIKKNIINQTIHILLKRINELGISDSTIQPQGKNNIIIEIPGIQDIFRAKNIIGKTATLNFMLVDTKNNFKKALKGNIPKYSKFFLNKNGEPVLLKAKSILNGDDIIYASAGFENQLNKPCINIKLDKKNIDLFKKTTAKNIGKPMAIIYKENIINEQKQEEVKETVINIATIMSPLDTSFQITGLNVQQSKDLAILLRSGSLPATISIMEEKIIGPTLGEKNMKNGLFSVYTALVIIMLFMLIRYKKLGIIANICLATNLILLIAIMSIIGVTLTLPGLAGIALTIGMSIDANILIFERIREEIKKEKNYIQAIEDGFKHAFSSIIDSNLTTLIIGLVLLILGSGPIRGFAVTLSIGILTSIYSSVFMTETIIKTLITKNIKMIKK